MVEFFLSYGYYASYFEISPINYFTISEFYLICSFIYSYYYLLMYGFDFFIFSKSFSSFNLSYISYYLIYFSFSFISFYLLTTKLFNLFV